MPDDRASAAPAAPIVLSLVSHTNVGKTTLARTLLGRDIGEVRDAAHVTQAAEGHVLASTPEGDRLELWDTPGFGDSVRLARRLAQAGNPIGWFLTEVWDRFRDRAFFSSQKAIRHVVDRADVVLYLVNAAEPPADASYLAAEFEVLRLLDKPVLVLLNQMGQPAAAAVEQAELVAWREQLTPLAGAQLRAVLPLDAFARCWVQEGTWLDAVQAALPTARQASMQRLKHQWTAESLKVFHDSMDLLADRLVAAAIDREPVTPEGLRDKLKGLGQGVGAAARNALSGRKREAAESTTPDDAAIALLMQRLQRRSREDTNRLIAWHRLDGAAGEQVLQRVAGQFAVRQPLDEGKAAVWGGVVAGALTGLKADIATGGLTLGGGMLAGSLLGALGAAGAARGFNVLRGQQQPVVTWRDEALRGVCIEALLSYLAVAHYGRGRGQWADGEHPAHWLGVVERVVDRHAAAWATWMARRPPEQALQVDEATVLILRQSARPLLRQMGQEVLAELYPGAWPAVLPSP
jgi:hypothetical protein